MSRLLAGLLAILIASVTADHATAQQSTDHEFTLTPNEWRFMPGAEAPTVSTFAGWGGVIFMGTHDQPNSYTNSGALFMSPNGGHTWRHAQLGGPITQLVTTPHTIIAVVQNGALYFSTDGRTWQTPTPVIGGLVANLTSMRDMVFAMTGHYGGTFFHRSFDGGQTFETLPMPDFGFAQLQAVGQYLFAGTSDGLFRSRNFGETWHPVNSFSHPVIRLAELDGILFAVRSGSSAGVYRSANYGATWEYAGNGLPNAGVGLLQALTLHDGSMYMSVTGASIGSRGIYVSHDGGYTWVHRIIPGLSDQHIPALHSTGKALLAGTGEGTFRTENGGATWSRSDEGASAAIGVSGIYATNDRLVIGTSLGLNWGHGIWWTEDHGASWQPSSHPLFRPTTFHEYGDELLAGGSGSPRGVARSSDGGTTWTTSNSGMWQGTIVYDIYEYSGTLFAAGHDALYRSTDGGYNWTATEPGGLRSIARYGGALYASHNGGGVFRSSDGGQSWTPFTQGLTGDALNGHVLLAHERRLYLGTDGLGVWRLDGDQWTHIGPGSARVTTMVGIGGGLVIGTRNAPYLWSWNVNGSWEPFDDGLMQRRVDVLVRHGSNLYVGLPLGGLWHRPVPRAVASNQVGDPDAGIAMQPDVRGVYPNPATTSAVIALELGDGGPAVVQLLDVLGREVVRWEIPEDRTGLWQQTVDTSRLAAGTYLVRASGNGGTVIHRLTVIR